MLGVAGGAGGRHVQRGGQAAAAAGRPGHVLVGGGRVAPELSQDLGALGGGGPRGSVRAALGGGGAAVADGAGLGALQVWADKGGRTSVP